MHLVRVTPRLLYNDSFNDWLSIFYGSVGLMVHAHPTYKVHTCHKYLFPINN
jgi:hypothetical protein